MTAFSAREAIKAAALRLLEERPLREITVKDIVQECGVNRNTFYYHFRDIPALLEDLITDQADRIIAAQGPALSLADWARRLIPDRILLTLVVNRIVWFVALEGDFSGIFDILLACLVPAALLALILLGEWLTARELMGGGDIKLLFALALYLSWAQLLLTLLAGCLLGLVFAALLGKKRDAAVPFGPFLALGGLFTVSLGAPLIRWYFGLF